MKIYKVCNVRNPGREHDGYEYFSNKDMAQKKQTANEKKYTEMLEGEDDEEPTSYEKDIIKQYEINLTKNGILDFLNRHASYPDNG